MVSRPARLWGPLLLLLTMVVPAPVLATGSGRLPRDVLPTSEHLKLNLDARKPRYSGSAVIQLRAMTAVVDLSTVVVGSGVLPAGRPRVVIGSPPGDG